MSQTIENNVISDKYQEATGVTDDHIVALKNGQGLHKSIMADFEKLHAAALRAGFDLQVISGFRSYQRQLTIWNAKYDGERPVFDKNNQPVDLNQLSDHQKITAILNYSALPGLSRHHWGTDFDIYDAAAIHDGYAVKLEPHEYEKGGVFYGVSEWLNANAAEYGFFRPYEKDLGGTAPELWHLSHHRVATPYMQYFNDELTLLDTDLDQLPLIKLWQSTGLQGIETIIDNFETLLKQYVLNISSLNKRG